MSAVAPLLCFVVWLAGAPLQAEDRIPIIGIDNGGKELVRHVPRKKYVSGTQKLLSSMVGETLPALNQPRKRKRWTLRTLTLGVGFDIEIGFSPLFDIEFFPHIRAIFSNTASPVIP